MQVYDLKRDKKLLRVILNEKNMRILWHISRRDDHRLKTIGKAMSVSEATVSRRIKNMKAQGVIEAVEVRAGRTPATWALRKRAAAIIEELET